MPCFANGLPITPQAVPPEHFHFTDTCTNGDGETISISEVMTKHCVMEQLITHWEAIPTTSEFIVLKKISGIDGKITTILRQVNPIVGGDAPAGMIDLVCVIPYYFEIGDTLEITYPNTEDQDVGTEIMLVEVF